MATESELFAALRNADAAGDSAAARRFAEMIQESRAASQRGIQSTIGKSSPRVDWTSRLPITYTKDGKDQTVPPGDLASRLESEGWTRKYPGQLSSAALSASVALGNMIPFTGGMAPMAGGVKGTYNWLRGGMSNTWSDEVDKAVSEKKDLYAGAARENPTTWKAADMATQVAALPATLRAMTLGRLGGPLAKTGSLLKAAGKTTAEAGLAGGIQASNQAPPGQRLEAGVKGALTSAAVAAPMALVSSPFLRDPSHVKVDEANSAASMVPAHAPELSWRNPSSLLNPESQRNYGATERIRSLESTPKMVGELASNFKNPVTGQPDLVAAGRAVNDATIPSWAAPSFGVRREMFNSEWLGNKAQAIRERYPWTQKILGTGAVPLLTGEDAQGAAKVFGSVRNKTGPAIAQMEENKGGVDLGEFFARARSGPGTELSENWAIEPSTARQFEDVLKRGEAKYVPQNSGTLGPGGPAAPGTVADLADIVNVTRAEARKRAASPGSAVSPNEATLGTALADASNIGARMKDEQMARALTPEQFSRYKDVKNLHFIASRGDDATNEFRSAARRPEGLTQVIYGAAGAGIGGQFGLGGAIAGRQGGRELATQMQSGTGARAARATRFAEGIEGKGVDPFWQAAGAAARGVQSAPGRTILATSAKTGSGMPDLLPSQPVVLVDKATREERAVSPDEAESLVASGKYETKDNAFVRTASRLAAGAKNAASSLTR